MAKRASEDELIGHGRLLDLFGVMQKQAFSEG